MPSVGGSTRRTAYQTITNTVLNLTDENDSDSKAVTMPAEIRGFHIFNPNPDTLYLKIFSNPAASVVIANDAPDEVYELPGNQTCVRPSRESRPWVVHTRTASFAITTQREAGGTAGATACEGWIEFGCAALTREGNLI